MRRSVSFDVYGIAQPKGSARAFVPLSWAREAVARGKQPRAVITTANPSTTAWSHLVRESAQTAATEGLFDGPIVVVLEFFLARPKSLPKRGGIHHTTRPDVDKLARAVLDALTGILYVDDSAVVALHAWKIYSAIGIAPHVRITVQDAVSHE